MAVKHKRTVSDTGVPLIVEISDNDVDAFRTEKPEIKVYGKKKGISEKQLEEALYRKPVMSITKLGKNKYNVDFESGFQRASIPSATRKDLIDSVNIEMYHGKDIKSNKGFLEWLGLNPNDRDLDKFLDRKKLTDIV